MSRKQQLNPSLDLGIFSSGGSHISTSSTTSSSSSADQGFDDWMPGGYGSIPKRVRVVQPRPKKAITATDRQLADLIAPQRSQYLVKPRAAAVPRDERITQMKQRLLQQFPQRDADELYAQATSARSRIAKEKRAAAPPKAALPPAEEFLRKVHTKKPNVMTNPKYMPVLQKFRGTNTSEDVTHQKWIGRVPQTLDQGEYDAMAQNFAEMVGVAHMRPEFDRALLTERSARKKFGANANKYTYSLEDMDNDPNTPGTLIIKKDGRMISAGGYRLPNATAGQTERLMKDMHYYNANPTAESRKHIPRNDFFYDRHSAIYQRKQQKVTGLKQIVDFITSTLQTVNVTAPQKGQPTYITLTRTPAQSAPQTIIAYSLSPIAWNSVIKHMAQLYAYYYIFPSMQINGNESIACKALAELRPQQTIEQTQMQVPPNFTAPQLIIAYKYVFAWTNRLFIEPRLEAAILRDPMVQAKITETLTNISNGTLKFGLNAQTMLQLLVVTVCGTMMNVNLPLLRTILRMAKDSDERMELLKLCFTSSATFEFVNSNNESALETQISEGRLPLVPLTPMKNLDDTMGVIYVGGDSEYVEPTLRDSFEPEFDADDATEHDDYPEGGEFVGADEDADDITTPPPPSN